MTFIIEDLTYLTIRLRDVRPEDILPPVDDLVDLLVVPQQLQVDQTGLVSEKNVPVFNFLSKSEYVMFSSIMIPRFPLST
jgi:hypothetical protein